MNHLEKSAVKIVSKIAPWLAPFPSAFFVARASQRHLALPVFVAVVVAAIIETLGIATVHTALWLADWNEHKRKSDPVAPVNVAVLLGVVYIISTIGLTVVLEIVPSLSVIAPALFPALAVVGAVNLALISRQENRENAIEIERQERKEKRQGKRKAQRQDLSPQPSGSSSNFPGINAFSDAARQVRLRNRQGRLDALLTVYLDDPGVGPTEAGRRIGVSRQTVYDYLSELEKAGKIARNDGVVKVL